MENSTSSLSLSRDKRSTAGNKMQALLAGEYQLEHEEAFLEVENDGEFIGKDVDDDVYDEDFQDTDEEDGQDDDFAGEKTLQKEENDARKAARVKVSNLPRIRLMLTKKSAQPGGSTSMSPAKKRKVALGVAVNAETGEVLTTRSSKRTATVMHTRETKTRIMTANHRRASIQKRVKTPTKSKTQDELIREALELEEQNTKSLQEFLSREEEKRKQARVVRPQIQGPLIRWVSRAEDIKTVRNPQPRVEVMVSVDIPSRSSVSLWGSGAASKISAISATSPAVTGVPLHDTSLSQIDASTPIGRISSSSTSTVQETQQPVSQTGTVTAHPVTSIPNPLENSILSATSLVPRSVHANATETTPAKESRSGNTSGASRETVKRAVNYVVLQLGEGATRRSHMEAMFGKHTNWSKAALTEMREARNKAIAMRSDMCPLSGLKAKYFDRRSGIPYANVRSYKTIAELLNHKYVWSSRLNCYTNHEDDQGAKGVPAGWNAAVKYGGKPSQSTAPKGPGPLPVKVTKPPMYYPTSFASTSTARLQPVVVIPARPGLSSRPF